MLNLFFQTTSPATSHTFVSCLLLLRLIESYIFNWASCSSGVGVCTAEYYTMVNLNVMIIHYP